jgi:Meiotically up-regulated gene 113
MAQNTAKVQVGLYSFEYKEWLRTSRDSSSPQGYGYLTRTIGTNRYKIGRTNNLHVRLKQLQGQSPYQPQIKAGFKTSNPAWDEAYWRDRYQKYRIYGEWFEFDDKFYKEIVKLCFWSRHEEFRVVALATELARSEGIDFPSEDSDRLQKYKYFEQASCYLEVDVYNSTAHLEV